MVRQTTEADRAEIQAWIDRDPDHKGMSADFFIKAEPGTECMTWEDEEGPILYFRIGRALRVDMQFDGAQRDRTVRALSQGFPWLTDNAAKAGFFQMIFSSLSKSLIGFCKRRFGFQESPNELICYIQGASLQRPAGTLEKPAQTVRGI